MDLPARTISARKGGFYFMLVLALLMVLPGLSFADSERELAWGFVLFGLLLLGIAVLTRKPRLSLSSEGLVYSGVGTKLALEWTEVEEVFVMPMAVYHGFGLFIKPYTVVEDAVGLKLTPVAKAKHRLEPKEFRGLKADAVIYWNLEMNSRDLCGLLIEYLDSHRALGLE